MIERTVQTINGFPMSIKFFSVLIAFLAPLAGLIHVIIGLLLVDMITIESYALFTWKQKAYLVTIDGSLREINTYNLTLTTIGVITGLGGAVQGACSTLFRNNNI